MSLTNLEKWLLVEYGNGVHDLVPSDYLVIRPKLELTSGCSITISHQGEQQLATYLARSNDSTLLRQIIGTEPGAGVPPEPEVEDYSPSASSWEPSDNESTDSEVEIKKPRLEVTRKRNPKEKRNNKVIKPSTKVKPVIPNSQLQKVKKMTMKTYKNCLKKQHETAIKALENKKATKSTAHLGIQRSPTKHITITVDINYVVGMLQAMNKLVTSFKLVKDVPQQSKEDQNETLKAKSVDTIGEESCRSDDSNRSGDNVLISNKYVNIENNKQEAIANEQPELTTKNSDTQAKNTTNEASSTENEKDMQGTVKNYDTKQDETTNVTKQEKILSETQKQDTVKNTPLQKKDNKMQSNKGSNDLNDENEWVPIGSGKTFIHKEKFRKVKWTSYTIATRSLLLALFPRRTLATHSLTGKKSPAFQNKPAKMCLDPKKISDIIIEVMDRFDVKENLVRSIITTKCADESKMFRTRMEKMKKAVPKQQNIKKQNECDKENN